MVPTGTGTGTGIEAAGTETGTGTGAVGAGPGTVTAVTVTVTATVTAHATAVAAAEAPATVPGGGTDAAAARVPDTGGAVSAFVVCDCVCVASSQTIRSFVPLFIVVVVLNLHPPFLAGAGAAAHPVDEAGTAVAAAALAVGAACTTWKMRKT